MRNASVTNVTNRQAGTAKAIAVRATCYHERMDRIIDKAIVLACCALTFAVVPWSGETTVALLVAIAMSALCELIGRRWEFAPALAYTAAACVAPSLALFLPLAAYDLARADALWPRVLWAIPAAASIARGGPGSAAQGLVLVGGCVAALLLGFRAKQVERARAQDRQRRDELRESALALESKYAKLADRQDLEVRLAMLDERSRIAREIHDNVGHLLTRSVLQVNALQIVHRDDPTVVSELSAVGDTVNEALDAVRASVHDLHDDGFDLETQLRAAAAVCEGIAVRVDFSVDAMPDTVGYSFLAIAREALSNTARHSNASRARIAVTEHPGFYRLVVEDNGRPNDPAAHKAASLSHFEDNRNGSEGKGGIGLASMRDRAAALGGTFRVSRARGFAVFVSVPKKTAQKEASHE